MRHEGQLLTVTAHGGNLRCTSFVGDYRVNMLPIRPTTVTRYCRRVVTVARHRDPFFLCTAIVVMLTVGGGEEITIITVI